jgi:hypothetical protein
MTSESWSVQPRSSALGEWGQGNIGGIRGFGEVGEISGQMSMVPATSRRKRPQPRPVWRCEESSRPVVRHEVPLDRVEVQDSTAGLSQQAGEAGAA